MLVHPRGFLAEVAALCRKHDVHLIVDEVATGFGRTGPVFACEQERVAPDFLCLAKGIAGGYLPLAATLSTEHIYREFLGKRSDLRQFFHGHTFTANPLACAVGLESLALLREETLPNAKRLLPTMESILDRMRAIVGVREVRSCGWMIGIELESKPDRFRGVEVCQRARSHGVILRPLGDVVVWMPPLSTTANDLELLESATRDAILDEVWT
jgi:adenosylmethionine-8-amino-7-oxononanoate aminotransferase